jgi:effector-binding domain-containing protein
LELLVAMRLFPFDRPPSSMFLSRCGKTIIFVVPISIHLVTHVDCGIGGKRRIMKKRIEVKDVKSFRVAALRVEASRSEEEEYFKQLFGWLRQKGVRLGKKLAIFCEKVPEFDSNSVTTYEVCFEIEGTVKTEEGIQIKEIPGQRVATLIHNGSREKILSTYETLIEWIKNEGYVVKGPPMEVYTVPSRLRDESGLTDYTTEIQFPIEEESLTQRLFAIMENWIFAHFFVVFQWTLLFFGAMSSSNFPMIIPGSRADGELKVITVSHFWILLFSTILCFLFYKHRHRGVAGKTIFVASLTAALFSIFHFILRFVNNLFFLMVTTEIVAWVSYLLVFATSVYSILVVFIASISRKVARA